MPLTGCRILRSSTLFLWVVCAAVYAGATDEEKIILNRIDYFYRLRSVANNYIWPGFDNPAFELPLIYYTSTHCYVVNPTKKFLSIYKPPLIHKKGRLRIYKTGLLDSTAFHMETFMDLTDTTAYNYKSMFMRCSSLEVTRAQPQAQQLDLERWATLVLHEFFHGYQFTHPGFAAYHRDSIIPVWGENLKQIYDDNPSVKEGIDRENELLLKALKTDDNQETKALLDSFFVLRKNRQDAIKRATGFDLGKYEEFYETTEGTARYIEYGLAQLFRTKKRDKILARMDTAYHAYQYFRTFNLPDESSMYLTSQSNYVYAIGFNMVRLADKFKLQYKKTLFKQAELSLEQILRTFLKNSH